MGNGKSCIKSKTSDDLERGSQGRQSVSEQGEGQGSSRSSLRSASRDRALGPNEPDVAGTISRSASRASKNHSKSTKKEDDPEIQEVETSGAPDLEARSSSSRASHVRPAGRDDDDDDDDGRTLMEQLDQKYGSIEVYEDLCHVLWKESHHLTFNRDYKFSPESGLSCNFGDRFYAEHPTYDTFRKLLKKYSKKANRNVKTAAEEKFLEEILKTKVVRICWAFLRRTKRLKVEWNVFKDVFREIWFHTYAFEHVFVGYIKNNNQPNSNQVEGQHNWFQYHLEQKKGNIVYKNCVKQVEKLMVALKYRWKGYLNECGSMFIGTSPEFEMALYTLLYYQTLDKPMEAEQVFHCDFSGRGRRNSQKVVKVKVVIDTEKRALITAYPMKP